jgi:hypothetical protein
MGLAAAGGAATADAGAGAGACGGGTVVVLWPVTGATGGVAVSARDLARAATIAVTECAIVPVCWGVESPGRAELCVPVGALAPHPARTAPAARRQSARERRGMS